MLFLIINGIIPIIYFLLLLLLIRQQKIFSNGVFNKQETSMFFALKVLYSIAYGFYYTRLGYGDTVSFYNASNQVISALYRDPIDYLQLVFSPANFFNNESIQHYKYSIRMYGNESSYFIIRIHSLLRLISFSSYYTHCIIYSFITLHGTVKLLSFFTTRIPTYKYFLIALLFFFPGIAFWCSGFHKEGLVLAASGYIIQWFDRNNLKSNFNEKILSLFYLIFGITIIGIIRFPFLLILSPILFTFTLSKFYKIDTLIVFISSNSIVLISSMIIHFNNWRYDIIGFIENRRNDFKELISDNKVSTLGLSDIIISLKRIFILPLNNPEFNFTGLFFLLNSSIILIILLYLIVSLRKYNPNAVILFITILSSLIIIGFIVTETGAISRYKSPLLFTLIASLVLMFDYKKKNII